MEHRAYKLVVLGAGGVGKSALTIRMVTDNFLENYDPTIEDTYRKQIMVDGEPALLDILDTAGQEEFECMRDQWITDGDGFALVYSIVSRPSLEQVKSLYENILRIKEDEAFLVVLCGNKCDLTNLRQIEFSEGKTLADGWGCSFYETSAKTKMNSEAPFIELIQKIRELRKNAEQNTKKKSRPCIIL